MIIVIICLLLLLFSTIAASQTSLCVPGECIEQVVKTSIGVSIGSLVLLPGSYTAQNAPQILRNVLSSSVISPLPQPGFTISSIQLPFSVSMQPGLAATPDTFYAGEISFFGLPGTFTQASIPISPRSISMSPNIWTSVSTPSHRFILWQSVPDVSQLPLPASETSNMTVADVQYFREGTSCTSGGTASPSGCACNPGFTGPSCELCAAGFFGQKCQACPATCTSCDDGLTGSGRCKDAAFKEDAKNCNCVNGECATDGSKSCFCNVGWTDDTATGKACGKCAKGFFSTPAGDCQICAPGCSECADTLGTCLSCEAGLVQDPDNKSFCIASPRPSDGPLEACPPIGFFPRAGGCVACSSECRTCTGETANDCVACADGTFTLRPSSGGGSTCVAADEKGICRGDSGLIADNALGTCNTCGARCTECQISGFNPSSTREDVQCSKCLKGSFLFEGKCLDQCPAGTFVSSEDGMTCLPCDSSCTTCSGSSSFCLSCPNNHLADAQSGRCTSSCPSNTFATPSQCLTCHADCTSCSGPGFSQCLSCPGNRPILRNGQCLPISSCGNSAFFDSNLQQCVQCDASCGGGGCLGAGSNMCLGCGTNSDRVLRAGRCVEASCGEGKSVLLGLGICLTDIGTPNTTQPSSPNTPHKLEWWQILLMALGCAFILMMFLMCWRRRARQKRAEHTANFAAARNLDKHVWRRRIAKLFKRHTTTAPDSLDHPHGGLPVVVKTRLGFRATESDLEARHERDIEQLIGSYEYDHQPQHHLSGASLYSQMTGKPSQVPETRQPVKDLKPESDEFRRVSYWVEPAKPPAGSRNPFRQLL